MGSDSLVVFIELRHDLFFQRGNFHEWRFDDLDLLPVLIVELEGNPIRLQVFPYDSSLLCPNFLFTFCFDVVLLEPSDKKDEKRMTKLLTAWLFGFSPLPRKMYSCKIVMICHKMILNLLYDKSTYYYHCQTFVPYDFNFLVIFQLRRSIDLMVSRSISLILMEDGSSKAPALWAMVTSCWNWAADPSEMSSLMLASWRLLFRLVDGALFSELTRGLVINFVTRGFSYVKKGRKIS